MFDTHKTRMIRLPHGKETMNIAVPSLSVNPPLIDHSFIVVELIPYKDGFENWSSQWLSRENLNFKSNNDWWRYFVVKARIYTVSLLDFINFIS